MSKQLKIQSELEKLSPYLAKLKAKGLQDTVVPEAYFESLPDNVLIRARAEEGLVHRPEPLRNEPATRAPIWRWLFNWQNSLALASVLLVLGVATYWFYPSPPQLAEATVLDQLQQEEIDCIHYPKY